MYFLTIDWWFIIGKAILIAAIIGLSFFIAMYTTYAERKVAAWLQDRRGPNRAGPFGILQPLADGGKLFFLAVTVIIFCIILIFKFKKSKI